MISAPPIDLMIVGAQKAATSSLLSLLAQHPSLNCQAFHEMRYFTNDAEYRRGYDLAFAQEFPNAKPRLPVVAKNAGVLHTPKAIDRLAAHNDTLAVAALLREPVARAYSAYWWARVAGIETATTFEQALNGDSSRFANAQERLTCDYLGNSSYADKVASLFARFGRERVHIFFNEDMRSDASEVCKHFFRLLNVDESFEINTTARVNAAARPRSTWLARSLNAPPPFAAKVLNAALPRVFVRRIRDSLGDLNRRSIAPPPIDPDTWDRLREHFEPLDRELAAVLGRKPPWAH
jgi:hypothetical protein